MFSFFRTRQPEPAPHFSEPQARRVLFLDDDPSRAEVFLAENPEAVWVQTAAECIARLAETWNEVHLDHDLGGEHFVDLNRDDCGMEVVRWLSLDLRPHLSKTRFYIHSHNPVAATMMGMQMMMNGYKVQVRPFGSPASSSSSHSNLESEDDSPDHSLLAGLAAWFRRLLGRETYNYPSTPYADTGSQLPPLEAFDFKWQIPPTTPPGSPDSNPLPTSGPLPDSQNPTAEVKGQNS